MLNVRAIPNISAAKNYFKAKNADYHIEGQEAAAYWHGKGAELLGLSGEVGQDEFMRLCENQHPFLNDHKGEPKQLTAKHIDNRRVGYDITFSLPKSVSLVAALGVDERIEGEFRAAVAETMAEVEREMATRVRKKGADHDRPTGNMIWADFLHRTSRPVNGHPDPQYHIHAVVFNATYDREEGQWKAGQFGGIKKDAQYFQAVFWSRMANRLEAMGYHIRRTKDAFEIDGVPERAIKEFSRRTGVIEKVAAALGISRPASKAGLAARTREAKDTSHSWDDLLLLWKARLTPPELADIEATRQLATGPWAVAIDNAAALDLAVRHAFERNSVVSQRELVTHALRFGLGEATPEGILEEVGRRRDLIRREEKGIPLVTTRGVLQEEKDLVAFAKSGRGRWRPLGPVKSRSKGNDQGTQALPLKPPGLTEPQSNLSPSQQAAIRHAWNSRDRLILIRGAAGTGKSTLTKQLLAGVDVPYVILAPSAEASRGVLRKEGFQDADTLAKFLLDEDLQQKARDGLIVLDEASLAGAHDVARLVESADKLNARVLLLGDRRQHRSVARGDVLALLEDSAGLPVAEVGEIKRQSGEYKKAVKLASEGRVGEAFGKLDKLGWIKEGGLVEDYLAAVREGKSVLVVSPTHAEGGQVTAEIRERLKQEGKLDEKERRIAVLESRQLTEAEKSDPETLRQAAGQTAQFVRNGPAARAGDRVTISEEYAETLAKQASRFVVYRPGEIGVAAGDLLRITANGTTLDKKHRLNNGAVYSVKGFTPAGDIRLNNDWVIGKDFSHLQHGYVVTSHGAQGRTVDKVLIAQSSTSFPASDKSQFYVSISRARQQATVYTDSKPDLLEAVNRDRPRMLATELVRKPRHKLRERLKKHLAFVRGVVARSRGHDRELVVQRELEVDLG